MSSVPARDRALLRSGFTLIEVVVVLAVLLAVIAVVGPAFTRGIAGPSGSVAVQILELLAETRDEAATRGVMATLQIRLADGEYRIIAEPLGTYAPTPVRGGRLEDRSEIRLHGGRDGWANVSFEPLGRARGTSIHVSDGELEYVISVDPLTGAFYARRQ